jgi:hypothetical protein
MFMVQFGHGTDVVSSKWDGILTKGGVKGGVGMVLLRVSFGVVSAKWTGVFGGGGVDRGIDRALLPPTGRLMMLRFAFSRENRKSGSTSSAGVLGMCHASIALTDTRIAREKGRSQAVRRKRVVRSTAPIVPKWLFGDSRMHCTKPCMHKKMVTIWIVSRMRQCCLYNLNSRLGLLGPIRCSRSIDRKQRAIVRGSESSCKTIVHST